MAPLICFQLCMQRHLLCILRRFNSLSLQGQSGQKTTICQQETCSLDVLPLPSLLFPPHLLRLQSLTNMYLVFSEIKFHFCPFCFTCLIYSVVSALLCGPFLFCSLSFLFCTSSLSHILLVFLIILLPSYPGPPVTRWFLLRQEDLTVAKSFLLEGLAKLLLLLGLAYASPSLTPFRQS